MLQIGDIVTLNSGGLRMEVVSIDGPTAVVKYEIDEQYPLSCLRKVFGQDQEFMGKKELLGKATRTEFIRACQAVIDHQATRTPASSNPLKDT